MSSGRLFVERAGVEDVPALEELARACHSHPWTAGQIRDEIALGAPGAFLALRVRRTGGGVDICGSCAYRVVVDELHVLDVAVHPSLRRRGLARFLVRLALQRGLRAGCRVGLLEVRAANRAALGLYESLGFRILGRRRGYYREPEEDALLMQSDDLARLAGLC